MALPIVNFQPETFAQTQPVAQGISTSNQLLQQALANKYLQYQNQISQAQAQYAQPSMQQDLLLKQLNNQVLQPQAQYAPQLTLADLALKRAMPGYYGSLGGLYNTEAAKGQFGLNNPTTLLPGVAGQIGAYNVLKQMDPNLFGSPQVSQPSQDQTAAANINSGTSTLLPSMPSAGNFTSTTSGNSGNILPNNPYANPALANAIVSQVGAPTAGSILGGGNSIQSVPNPTSSGGLPQPADFANLMFQGQFAPIQKDIAQTKFYNTKSNLANFQSLPPDTRNNMIAQGRGLGLNPNQTVSFISSGGDLNKLSSDMAASGQNTIPQYAPAAKNVQQAQLSTAALSSLNDIEPTITNALAPYSRQIFGHSPKLMAQEFTGTAPESQAQALAARALAPEISSLRLKAMNANVGIEAIKEVQDKSMLELNNFQGAVSPKVFKLANQYMDQWITKMNQSYNNSLYNKTGQSPTASSTILPPHDPLGIR